MRIRRMIRRVMPLFLVEYYDRRKLQYIYKCSVCRSHLAHFNRIEDWRLEMLDKYNYIHSIFTSETFNMLKYSCPVCGASDRDRLYAVYLTERFGCMDKSRKYRLLDIGPVPSLSNFLQESPNVELRSADLYGNTADDKIDIMDMNIYPDNSFDVFICSHVLEHVSDDKKGMNELYRILKPTGWGIVMVPICLTLKDVYEDKRITDKASRWKHFGQDDHVRLYSKQGFVDRLQEAGFRVDQLGVDYFGSYAFETYGIHRRSVLYVVEKEKYEQAT